MSEPTKPRLKVSREGVVLIKSFEGFRPRAVQNDDGRWIIGYGHTASAREGLSVSEADAELLLQYDLIPIVRTVNDAADGLNQHQFDALASFALSVGLDRFAGSDVVRQLQAGALAQAADALFDWPETQVDAGLRRRAAERALFVADPSSPVHLADLLAAPLPPPPAPEPEPVAETPVEVPTFAPSAPPADARAAAVASLLGETAPTVSTPLTSDTTVSTGAAAPTPTPATDDVAADPAPQWDATGASVDAQPTDDNSAATTDDTPAFPVMRHEARARADKAKGFDWGYTGAFLIMGAIGFTACGAAAAAYRLAASRPSPSNETLVIAGVLGLIGAVCVAAAAWNLYVRWSKPD